MSIYGTCGHKLEDMGTDIVVKDNCKNGAPAVACITVCDKCLAWYRENNLELKTEQEQNEWIGIK